MFYSSFQLPDKKIVYFFILVSFYIYLTRKCLIEIKNVLYKSVLAKTAAAHYTNIQTIQHKTVSDDIKIKILFF